MEENKDLSKNEETSIFNLPEEELYDDDFLENKPKKKRKIKKNVVAIAVASIILMACSIGCIAYGVIQHNKVSDLKNIIKESETTVTKYESQIKELTASIALKDEELNKIKQQQVEEEQKLLEEKQNEEEKTLSMNFKVVSSKGLNIRVEPNANSEVKASLASGDTFIQVGSVITAEDGSKWVELKWENGYGCIESANGDVYAERQ